MRRMKRKLATLLLLITVSAAAQATDVRLTGSGSYTIDPASGTVSVRFSEITNHSTTTTSGTLYLQLWASPDNDPTGSGYGLTDNLNVSTFIGGGDGTLDPGARFTNIEINTSYNAPPDGSYHVFFILAEYPNTSTILDSVAGEGNPVSLGGSGGGDSGGGDSGGGDSGGGDSGGGGTEGLDLVCSPCGYEVDDSFVTLNASAVRNNRDGGTSGTLRLKLWATDSPYSGGSISGYVMGEARLGELRGGYEYSNISEEVIFSEPPAGTYWVTMTLSEYDGEDLTVDYITFDDTETFGSGGSGTDDGSGGDDGSDSGGDSSGSSDSGGDSSGSSSSSAAGPAVLILLALVVAFRRLRTVSC